ncbi:MAG: hypothetical protein ACP5N3_02995 [Candidatus Nanoarchaeia archaeon]
MKKLTLTALMLFTGMTFSYAQYEHERGPSVMGFNITTTGDNTILFKTTLDGTYFAFVNNENTSDLVDTIRIKTPYQEIQEFTRSQIAERINGTTVDSLFIFADLTYSKNINDRLNYVSAREKEREEFLRNYNQHRREAKKFQKRHSLTGNPYTAYIYPEKK